MRAAVQWGIGFAANCQTVWNTGLWIPVVYQAFVLVLMARLLRHYFAEVWRLMALAGCDQTPRSAMPAACTMIGSQCYYHLACKVNLYSDRATCMLNDTALGIVLVCIDAAVTSDLRASKSKCLSVLLQHNCRCASREEMDEDLEDCKASRVCACPVTASE